MISDQVLALANELGLERVVSFDKEEDQFVPGALHYAGSRLRSAKFLDLAGALWELARMPPAAALAVVVDVALVIGEGTSAPMLPLQTWKALLASAGFEALLDLELAHSHESGIPGSWLEQYWREADLFRQARLGSNQRLLLCRRNGAPIDFSGLSNSLDATLDIGYLRAKRDRYATVLARPIILNIHQIQDYLNLRPIIEVLDPQQAIPLIREHSEFKVLKRLAVFNDLQRQGFSPRLYKDIGDLDWSDLAGKPLLSATESAITPGHALSRQIVEAAKTLGCPTFLLQHGAWIEAFSSGPVSFGSQAILAWGSEHAQSFATPENGELGTLLPRGSTMADRFKNVGSPKFADMLWPADRRVLQARLGVTVANFSGITLIGTNFHWPRHTDKASFAIAIRRLIEAKQDELFILKTHPAEDFYDYEVFRADNVIIYDDVLALATDFHTPRLLNAADRIASSLSSLLIDASVLGKPVAQYDTGNTIRYSAIEPLPCDELDSIYSEAGTAKARSDGKALAATYADGDHAQFYTKFTELLSNTPADVNTRQDGLQNLSAFGLLAQVVLRTETTELRLADLRDLLASTLFDLEYYAAIIGDFGDVTPAEHFLTQGGRVDLNPRASFDSRWYRAQYLRAETGELVPVLHYIRTGARLGYDPHVLFSTSWYLAQVGDIPPSLTPLEHYLIYGEPAGVSCHPMFDPAFYARSAACPIVGSPLEHFLTAPSDLVADPSPSFSCSRYLQKWPDVRSGRINPLLHYLQAGAAERRARSDVQRHLR